MGKRAYDGSMVSRKRTRRGQNRFTRFGKTQTTNVSRTWPHQRYYDPVFFDPFPYKMQCIMRYTDTVVLDPITVAGTVSHHLFRANGIHKPDFTGIGHQPNGHDQWADIYTHYQVIESTATVQPVTIDDRIYGINLLSSTTEPDWSGNLEMKGSRFTHSYTDGVGHVVTNSYKDRTFGNKFQVSALFGASPVDPFFYDVFMQGRSADSTTGGFTAHVTITYKVKMWEPKLLGVS